MIVLVVLAGIAASTCWFSLAGIPALVLGIRALTLHGREPGRARRLARIGWIVLGAVRAFLVVVFVLLVVVIATTGEDF